MRFQDTWESESFWMEEGAANEGREGTVTAAFRDAEGDMHRYDDMIGLPRHVSPTHPQMPIYDRAAQFAPFAALSGHGEAIKEKQRQVEERIEHEYD